MIQNQFVEKRVEIIDFDTVSKLQVDQKKSPKHIQNQFSKHFNLFKISKFSVKFL